MRQIMLFMLMLIALFLVACIQQANNAVTIVSSASFEIGAPIPAPVEPPIITLSGDIATTNDGDSLVFDLQTLEQLTVVEYQVPDPWELTDVTYTGVLLSDLLKFAGTSDSATLLIVTALNDYASEIPISELEDWPVLLATRANGEILTIETNGPTRIIFPYDSYSDIIAARDMSVWNVGSIEVK